MQISTRYLTRAAIVAAIYTALTELAVLLNLAYGPIQFRFSDALCVLPVVMPEAVPGLFVGCLLSNILSPYGLLDIVIGSLATLLAALATAKCRKRALAPLPPVISNALLVGALIAWEEVGFSAAFAATFAYNALTVGLGEAAVCYLLGIPLLHFMEKGRVSR